MLGLEYIIKIKGLNGTGLGKMLGTSRQNISMWFSGRKIPKKQLPILSDILNVPQKSLFKNIDDKVVHKVGEFLVSDEKQLFETLIKTIELKGSENVKNKLKELL